ncbi:MAG: glycerol acyltransferase [SAR324 cluster bacterium]|uniref:Glycerol acyltransferase n=1 Tax=SAR324 cluster bacterium TaxID=2024889 RepID=A0A2A4T4W4_9DELT|nr:MAG: glycerol acyltransferase [SAR324 cluster bacterium]
MISWLAKMILKLFGWKTIGVPPDINKYVIIGAPHTTAWDFPIMLFGSLAVNIRVHWLGKASLFRGPWGFFFKQLGGIPINRSVHTNTVQQIINIFEEKEHLILTLSPEGTRQATDYWKSGFYYIALGANVPIYMGFTDYQRKLTGVAGYLIPTGNIEEDMRKIRAFYQRIPGKYPDQTGPIRLKEENSNYEH